MRKIHKVCVVGAGLMGKQIALNAALHGYLVMLNDSIPEAVGKAETWADEYLKGRVAKGKLTEGGGSCGTSAGGLTPGSRP